MKILSKKILSDTKNIKITRLEVFAPEIAKKAQPGQFVVLMISEMGERVPLTIVSRDKIKGSIVLIFQEVGLTTKLLGKLKTGDSLHTLVGPLGHPTKMKNYGRVITIGGGVGAAEIYPVAIGFKEQGNQVTTIIGARTKEMLILEEELKSVSSEYYVTTDDGTCGRKGFTTDVLSELIKKEKFDLVYAVGPIPMMKRVAQVTKDSGIKTVVSLNALMVDASGMCGCCRVTVGDETKFSCVDGPEFDAHSVDWEELEKRNRVYLEKEKHICNLSITDNGK